jgi:PiT family inorganic phosphate transporter
LRKTYRKELVKRTLVIKIAAAWVITVPCAGVMSAIIFYTI